ncbi:MAG TPA: hypothetical protein VGC10_09225 [Sphingomonas sp.]
MRVPLISNLVAGWRDLRAFFGTVQRYHYVAALVSVTLTGLLIWGFYHDSYFEQQPRIIYVENWPASRTDAEIQADQRKDLAEKHRERAMRRAAFQKLQALNERIGL